jgi:hypothetical protein
VHDAGMFVVVCSALRAPDAWVYEAAIQTRHIKKQSIEREKPDQ